MIKNITVTNHLGESITLELTAPRLSGFLVKKIEGLGPVKADVNMTELATNDGAIDNSARLQKRNIVLYLQFMQENINDETIEDLRLKSYKYFPIKRNITFLIETDNRICTATGRIESNEPDIFSKDEGCQISILCGDPYFYSAGEDGNNDTVFYGLEPLFEFPFENNSLDENLIEFGNIMSRTEGTVYYEGDAEVGLVMTLHAVGDVKGLSIYNLETNEIMKISDEKLESLTGSGIIAGDTITITTVKGQKGITLLRGGVTTNILNVLEKPIPWFQLSKGDNLFAYTATEGISNLQFAITNKTIYEGV